MEELKEKGERIRAQITGEYNEFDLEPEDESWRESLTEEDKTTNWRDSLE